MEGQNVTAIPAFGFERRGAPVAAFLRYSSDKIRAATNIYNPDYIICIDPTVANAVDIFAGVADQSTLVQNYLFRVLLVHINWLRKRIISDDLEIFRIFPRQLLC